MKEVGLKVYAMAKESNFTEMETSFRVISYMGLNLDMESIIFQMGKYIKVVFITIKMTDSAK